jgi:hypothetical protein
MEKSRSRPADIAHRRRLNALAASIRRERPGPGAGQPAMWLALHFVLGHSMARSDTDSSTRPQWARFQFPSAPMEKRRIVALVRQRPPAKRAEHSGPRFTGRVSSFHLHPFPERGDRFLEGWAREHRPLQDARILRCFSSDNLPRPSDEDEGCAASSAADLKLERR